ncbi:hypothetical protein PFISCL1PPCAC_17361, partial [Pristionchus fissidentatus]
RHATSMPPCTAATTRLMVSKPARVRSSATTGAPVSARHRPTSASANSARRARTAKRPHATQPVTATVGASVWARRPTSPASAPIPSPASTARPRTDRSIPQSTYRTPCNHRYPQGAPYPLLLKSESQFPPVV